MKRERFYREKVLQHLRITRFTDFTINPRVREQGRANFIADKSGTGAALLIYMQGRSITPRTFKMHEKPRDYVGANRVKIRQLMKKVKEREAQNAEKSKTEPVKALWKSDKYNNVTSKLKHMLEVITNHFNYSLV